LDDAIIQVAIQVPALFIVGYVFLRVLSLVLDVQGKKLERLADAWEAHNRDHRELR